MSELFLAILNMSITASYVIIFVILIRLAIQKAPKVISYALWVVVAFRLVIPFSFESVFSLLPQTAAPIPHDIIYQQKLLISSGILSVDTMVNEVLPSQVIGGSVNPMHIYIEIGAHIWMIGIITLLAYSLISIFRLKKLLKNAQLIEQNIYEADNLKTPFVLGIISPKIYLPAGLDKEEWKYILLHEQTHIYRKDHIIKITAFIILTIHWFNPLVWVAFMLMSIDMELSCDERVLKEINIDIKKSYANSLLTLATGRRILNGSPLAFGEGNVKWRIKNVLNYKKPRFWVVAISTIVVIAVGIGLIANPKTDSLNNAITDLRPMIMVNGELYLDTGKQIPVEIDESAIIGEVSSSVDQSEKPTEEGQTNFGSIGSKYAHFEENIVVLINNEWVLFEKETMD
ncbi:M56 family metallopeptidase [Sedimentibacter sp. MB35-C1]|nr:M56 family metallopeptidase [Sedimentibacter sp. MB35-C1]WMJ77491.1 M56 family metallopeptidase [Sedimentibacter sp. MB35-C1]